MLAYSPAGLLEMQNLGIIESQAESRSRRTALPYTHIIILYMAVNKLKFYIYFP